MSIFKYIQWQIPSKITFEKLEVDMVFKNQKYEYYTIIADFNEWIEVITRPFFC
jgi:hypothetical protein